MPVQTYTEIINAREAEFVSTLSYDEFFNYFPRDVKDDENGANFNENGANFKVTTNSEYFKMVNGYLKMMIKLNFEKEFNYKASDKNSNGRIYSKCPISLQRIHNPLRAFLTKGTFRDYDMKNAHPTIFLKMCEAEGLPVMYQMNYVENRAKVLKNNGTDKKTILIKLNTDNARANGSWNQELKGLIKEWNTAKKYFYKQNKDKYEKTNTKNKKSSIINKMMCEKENEILQRAMPDAKYIVPMFDGFMCSEELNISELPSETCSWDEKPITSDLEIPDDFTFVPEAEVVNENRYEDMKVEFEKKHAKIIENSCFVMINDEQSVILLSESSLITSYRHLHYLKLVDKGDYVKHEKTSFIQDWLHDPCQRIYNRMDCYPDNENCPENVFNLWIPFSAETWTGHKKQNKRAVIDFIKHCYILSGNDSNILFKVLLPFLAHMIQYPDQKSFVLNLISKQGSGKGTLIEIMTKILGNIKVLETQKPLRDVFGNFNALMKSSFLVCLDEVKKKDMIEVQGEYKGLVTEGTININLKGKDSFPLKSYHRFISTSNNDDSMPTQEGDRRNKIIRSSDELCIGNKEWHDKMHAHINDENAMWSIYQYLKNLKDVPRKFDVLSLPNSDYQGVIQEASREYIDLWLESFVREQCESPQPNGYDSQFLFENWLEFAAVEHINIEYTKPQFDKKLTLANMSEITVKRTKTQRLKQFDFVKLKTRFNIGCLI